MVMKKILLVEDAEDFSALVCERLTARGITVMVACNGEDGLSKLREASNLPDLIVTDIRMPIMNGLEFISRLNDDECLKHIPRAICSWDATNEGHCRIDGILLLPKDIPHFVESVCSALGV